ncbi:class F sortase [Candidatus Gracilibacteria bacterium]|nr:class F sortase [Candidatus Gracilibacteria bacterium]
MQSQIISTGIHPIMRVIGTGLIIVTLSLFSGLFGNSDFTKISAFSNSQLTYKSSIPITGMSFLGESSTFIKPIISIIPIHLTIPKINLNATVERVGLTPQGAMNVPVLPSNAGWLDMGPQPGEIGNAVIDGHYGIWKNGDLGVFNNLNNLQKGDKIYIKDREGSTIIFIVRELRTYRSSADASKVFISNDGLSHLNLITCTGVWNKSMKKYPDRLVVFSDREILK